MQSLRSLFADLDLKFFKGRLNGYQIKWAYLPGPTGPIRGRCNPESRTIKIQRGLRGEDLRRTVLHEMCHAGSTAKHGRLFERELKRLGKLGEKWIDEEIAAYREAQPLREMVEQDIENSALDLQGVRITWREVKRRIANGCGLTSKEFGKEAPWARKSWERKRGDFLAWDEMRRRYTQSPKP